MERIDSRSRLIQQQQQSDVERMIRQQQQQQLPRQQSRGQLGGGGGARHHHQHEEGCGGHEHGDHHHHQGHAHSHAPGQSDVERQIRRLHSSGKFSQVRDTIVIIAALDQFFCYQDSLKGKPKDTYQGNKARGWQNSLRGAAAETPRPRPQEARRPERRPSSGQQRPEPSQHQPRQEARRRWVTRGLLLLLLLLLLLMQLLMFAAVWGVVAVGVAGVSIRADRQLGAAAAPGPVQCRDTLHAGTAGDWWR